MIFGEVLTERELGWALLNHDELRLEFGSLIRHATWLAETLFAVTDHSICGPVIKIHFCGEIPEMAVLGSSGSVYIYIYICIYSYIYTRPCASTTAMCTRVRTRLPSWSAENRSQLHHLVAP